MYSKLRTIWGPTNIIRIEMNQNVKLVYEVLKKHDFLQRNFALDWRIPTFLLLFLYKV